MALTFRSAHRTELIRFLAWLALALLALLTLATSPAAAAAEEARWGKITDIQGLVSLKAATAQRWTPICGRVELQPGDWLRTDLRGANAMSVRLADGGSLTLGPGALVEVKRPDAIEIFSGDVEVVVPEGKSLEVAGPNKAKLAIGGKQILRARDEKLTKLDAEPAWLKGFRGAATEESLGSLVTTIDGRSVPLTVGYHKVSVDIRDQIARTVVEESFVNHTKTRLEGVFYFPLPADASISGFGMWIGDKLVEADVVEKQRAREIYETILREKRDPGLLEWSGGNIFKARVFPIEPHSEKRVKITYTQVLPMAGGSYRYSYALQSELLKENPLRELNIDVQVHSALPIASVSSPTHEVRQQKTAQSARVEFSAQEYIPQRDFEVVIETGQTPAVTMIPHRRGDDGYFILMLQPPGDRGAWTRELVRDGQPLDLIILADTSGSMDRAARKAQEAFIATLLSSLGERDTFQLGMCDVDCQWATPQPTSATPQHAADALAQLGKRSSLGWTNLDKTFAAVTPRLKEHTQVVYVGDGITTTGDADPVAFAARLKKMMAGKQGTFHAVATGSSYESAVLAAMASLGGGSVRRIGADASPTSEGSPQSVARALLVEMTEPGLRDLKVEFKGLRVARVYPEQLPNLAAGRQQIILGRYLPEAGAASGEVVVTGLQNGKPVTFHAAVNFDQAEEGNSFIPRLWSRFHLDTLLAQGASQAIRDEIIALSEEYQIMTPYTSFLVLETDADRERFKVQRRFQMRDGEKFFAEGRNQSQLDLLAQHMKQAAAWRTNMRKQFLQELSSLGRDPRMLQMYLQQSPFPGLVSNVTTLRSLSSRGGVGGFGGGGYANGHYAINGPMSGSGLYEDFFALGDMPIDEALGVYDSRDKANRWDYDANGGDWALGTKLFLADGEARFADALAGRANWYAGAELDGLMGESARGYFSEFDAELGLGFEYKRKASLDFGWMGRRGRYERAAAGKPYDYRMSVARGLMAYPYNNGPTLESLFPNLAGPPAKEPPIKANVAWPAEARALAESLLRTAQFERLAKDNQGLRIEAKSDWFDTRRDKLARQSETTSLVMQNAWSIRTSGDQSQTIINWCDDKSRGVFSLMSNLGRQRPVKPADLAQPPLDSSDYSLRSLERTYQGYKPVIATPEANRAMLTLVQPANPDHDVQILIDTERHVILSITARHKGEAMSTTRFDKFVEAAGGYWATQMETLDEKQRRSSLTTLDVQVVDAKKFGELMAQQLAPRANVLALSEPLPSVRVAKQKVASGKADFTAQLVVLAHFAATQQWNKIETPLAALEKISAGKPGFEWIKDIMLLASRRNEKLLEGLYAAADTLTAEKSKLSLGDQYALAGELARYAGSALQNREMMTLSDKLRPVYERQPKHLLAMNAWLATRAAQLDSAGQEEEAFAIRQQLAKDNPFDQSLQSQYAQALVNRGDYQAAYEWIAKVLAAELAWTDYEQSALRGQVTSWLDQQGEYERLVDYLKQWTALDPESGTPYQQLLSALLRLDRAADYDKLLGDWLQLAAGDKKLSPAETARLSAAINQALGQGYSIYSDSIEQRWLQPLAQTVRHLIRRQDQLHLANQIMMNSRFRGSDEILKLQPLLVEMLRTGVETLDPQQIAFLIDWVIAGEVEVDKPMWRDLTTRLEKRWAAAPITADKPSETKAALAQPLYKLLTSRGTQDEVLAFLRRQLKEGGDELRAAHAQSLLDTLLAQPWKQAHEDEAFALIDQTIPPAEMPDDAADARLAQQVLTLERVVDTMIAGRAKQENDKLEHPENLSRTELAEKRAAIEKAARTALADRLAQERDKHGDAMKPWIEVERLYWEVKIERNPAAVVGAVWEFLGPKPPAPAQVEGESPLATILRNRYLMTIEWIATRKDAPAGLADRLLAYLNVAVAADADDMIWKQQVYRLLVALDRPEELEKTLQSWIRPDVVDSTWRIALGYVLAEQSKLAEAIAQFEAVKTADELPAGEYRALAGWYLAGDDQRRHNEALVAAFMAEGENQLYRHLQMKVNSITNASKEGQQPIDQQTLMLLTALMQKSATPQNYYWLLKNLYDATHDFRLLESTADSVVGNTALKIYPLLGCMRQILSEVRDEATVDSIVAQVAQVRAKAQTETDRRAVDLLEMLVARRAAELKNQPGPHAKQAFAALQRAFKRPWAEGEPRLMAELLGMLGAISDRALAAEQLAELEALAKLPPAGSPDRLHIVATLANTLAAAGRVDDGISRVQIALEEFRQTHGGRLTQAANEELALLVSLVSRQSRYVQAESIVAAELKLSQNTQQRSWLLQQLYRVYYNALDAGGSTAAGKGLELYRDAQSKIIASLETGTPDFRNQLVTQLCEIYRKAYQKKLSGVGNDAVAFGQKHLPSVLRQQNHNYDSLLGTVADTIGEVAGPRAGLAFLITQVEQEPLWVRYTARHRWNQVSGRLGAWRQQVKDLGDLEPRLLKLVIAELRRDLLTGVSQDRSIFSRNHQYYWAQKEADFAAAAEVVLKEHAASNGIVRRVAEYFYHGLQRYGRAIEVLQIANAAKVLDPSGQAQLVNYLQEQQRFAESIDLLASLIERFPSEVNYRVQLMRAYFHTKQPAKLLALLKETDGYFHQENRWNEGALASLAGSTLETRLFEQSVEYYKELIPLHERTASNRGIGDGTLSHYYTQQSRALVSLKRTPEAVEAASAAIVSWGATHQNRKQAVENLFDILKAAPDLDAFVVVLDEQVKKSDLENPIVRQQIGKVYAERQQYAKAIKQLRAAAEVQPADNELQEALVSALVASNDSAGAAAQLLAWADVARRDLNLYKRLAQQYQKLEQPAEVERAFTTIVEMQPTESESHTLLAEVRQSQNRWPEAADEWREVARIRELEPTGLLGLAAAQIHLQEWDAANDTLRTLVKKDWPARFNTVQSEVQRLQQLVRDKK